MSKRVPFSFLKVRVSNLVFPLVVLFLLASNSQLFANQVCELKKPERQWLEKTIKSWKKTSRKSLQLKETPLPWMIWFDKSCVWHLNPDTSVPFFDSFKNSTKTTLKIASIKAYGFQQTGEIQLPNGDKIPAQLISFASTYNDGNKPFLVMSMPVIWREAKNLKAEKHLDSLIRGVFVHEMTHTVQSKDFGERLTEIEKQNTFNESFNDDIIQNHFGKSESFRTAYEKENKLLYEAVNEKNKTRRRLLAKSAFEMIKLRRKNFFSGENAKYSEIEEIFLTMEGLANWAAYQSIVSDKLNKTEALKLIRRDGKNWSQDEGLAIFLVVDSLLPNWQKQAFNKPAASAFDLLETAVK